MSRIDYVHAAKAFEAEPARFVTLIAEGGPSFIPGPRRKRLGTVDGELTWIRNSSAVVAFLFKGRVLKLVRRQTDTGPFLRSAGGLRPYAGLLMERWGIDSNSDVEIAVRTWLTDTPTFGKADEDPDYPSTRDRYFPMSASEERMVLWDGVGDMEAHFRANVHPVPVNHSVTDIWSSKRSPVENEAAERAFNERAEETKRTVGPIADNDDIEESYYG